MNKFDIEDWAPKEKTDKALKKSKKLEAIKIINLNIEEPAVIKRNEKEAKEIKKTIEEAQLKVKIEDKTQQLHLMQQDLLKNEIA